MYSNSLARHFSSMFHAKCLLPRLDRLLLVRSCLQNFYQCGKQKNQTTGFDRVSPLNLFDFHYENKFTKLVSFGIN